MTFRDDWLAAVRDAARKPPPKVRPQVALAVARAYFDHGDEDGTRIQAGRDTVAYETLVSPATVSRVRLWLIDSGLAHVESAAVKGRKALWWHAAMPAHGCPTCGASPVPTEERETGVPERSPVPVREPETPAPSPVPPPVPSPVPAGGTRPETSNYLGTEEEGTPVRASNEDPWASRPVGCTERLAGNRECGADTAPGSGYCAEHVAARPPLRVIGGRR